MRSSVDALRSLKKFIALALVDDVVPAPDGDRSWEIRLAYEEGAFRRPFVRVGWATQATYEGDKRIIKMTRTANVVCHLIESSSEDEATLEAGRVDELLARAFRIGAGAALAKPKGLDITGVPGTLPAGSYSYVVAARSRLGVSPPSLPIDITLNATGGAVLTWDPVTAAQSYLIYRGAVAGSETILAASSIPCYRDQGHATLGTSLPSPTGHGTISQPSRIPLWDWDGVPLDETSEGRETPDFLRVVDFQTDEVRDPRDERRRAVVADIRMSWLRAGAIPYAGQVAEELRTTTTISG